MKFNENLNNFTSVLVGKACEKSLFDHYHFWFYGSHMNLTKNKQKEFKH